MDQPYLDQIFNPHALEVPPPELPHRSFGIPQSQLEESLLKFNPLDPEGPALYSQPPAGGLLEFFPDEA